MSKTHLITEVESAEENDDVLTVDETEVSKSVIDILANLALRVTELERKLDRLGNSNERAVTAVVRDVETLAQELEEVKQRSKNETITITLDSQTVSKLITEVLLSAQANQNRINR